eukprot:sb/3477159/
MNFKPIYFFHCIFFLNGGENQLSEKWFVLPRSTLWARTDCPCPKSCPYERDFDQRIEISRVKWFSICYELVIDLIKILLIWARFWAWAVCARSMLDHQTVQKIIVQLYKI